MSKKGSRTRRAPATGPRPADAAAATSTGGPAGGVSRPDGDTSPDLAERWRAVPDKRRRKLLGGAVLLGAATFGAVALHRHDVTSRELHDLSVIGDGEPVVVQVHDPSCPTCRKLKGSTSVALESVPALRYRIADLTSDEGRALGEAHGVGKVTLLLFDGRGRRVDTVQGLTPVAELEARFARLLARDAPG